MRLIRFFLAQVLLFLNWLTWPKAKQLSENSQAYIKSETRGWTLYHFEGCPFCIKVRRAFQRLGIQVTLKDASRSEIFKNELLDGGKEYQTPCLRIDPSPTDTNKDSNLKQSTTWLYESSAIIELATKQFGSLN